MSAKVAVATLVAFPSYDPDAEPRYLVLHRKNDDSWELPGGKMESGESLLEAAAREALEETGLHVLLHDVVGVYSDGGEQSWVLVILRASCLAAVCMQPEGFGDNIRVQIEERTHDKHAWLTLRQISKLPGVSARVADLASSSLGGTGVFVREVTEQRDENFRP